MFKKIFIPIDNSKYSNYCSDLGVSIAKEFSSELVGGHVYAANLHHKRFKEMESGLPEKFREENELKKQREFHNTLIGKGLRMISDSYLDGLGKKCQDGNVPFSRNLKEGKNYLELVKDIKDNDYDLVIIGVRGLGETSGNLIGSVCERVVRRINTDVLIVKNDSPLEGKIVVAIDGSEQSFRSVEIACELARKFNLEIEGLSVFDPHYHRIAFAGIAKVLSGEMGNVFKSDEQEKLHEDVIDKGLEKIYHDHLKVASQKAKDLGFDLKTTLLEGKPYDQILKHIQKDKPSLLMIGRTGIHAISGLDIGSATENVLRFADCNVHISKSTKAVENNHFFEKATSVSNERPKMKAAVKTEEEVTWDQNARTAISKVPSFVQPMVIKEVENYAREKGRKEITPEIVAEARSKWSESMNYS